MCPLVSAPNRGYPDYQRIGNYDTGILYDIEAINVLGGITSQVLDVSRFAYIGGFIFEQTTSIVVTFSWYIDQAKTVPLGARSITLVNSIAAAMKLRIPMLGPYVQVQFNSLSGAATQTTARLFGTNRVHPLEIIPSLVPLIDVFSTSVTSGVALDLYPQDYYAGPAMIYAATGATAFNFDLQCMPSSGGWSPIHHQVIAANSSLVWNVILPPGAWRYELTQSSGANANAGIHITPSTTGAS